MSEGLDDLYDRIKKVMENLSQTDPDLAVILHEASAPKAIAKIFTIVAYRQGLTDALEAPAGDMDPRGMRSWVDGRLQGIRHKNEAIQRLITDSLKG